MNLKNQYFPQSVPHPGETLAEKLEEMQMGPKEFALRTGKPQKTIFAVLKGESAITADMAVQFEKVTRIPAHFWMNHQRGYDEYISREKRKAIIKEAKLWARKFPLELMIRKGWIQPVSKMEEKTEELLSFFGFSDHYGWEQYYFKQQLKVAFRISLAKLKEPYAISVWLRKGEIDAEPSEVNAFSAEKFKSTLPQIQSLIHTQPKDLFSKIQQLCLEAGVKLVQTERINKAPISGASRWLKDTPLIQLAESTKQDEAFWFTFFHEAGHILLHGKKDIFLENLDYSDKDIKKEEEADRFAKTFFQTLNG